MLSICIPTYNRREKIEKNLKLLSNYIRNNNLYEKIEIIVSNNNSKDDTKDFLENFLEYNKDINLKIYNQFKEIEMQKNLVFVVENSNENYIMWLSDDDYISEEYLLRVLEIIEENNDKIITIIPVLIGIKSEDEIDITKIKEKYSAKDKVYEKGFKTALNHSLLAHNMSGLVFKREIIDVYNERNVNNMYPFIFFSTYSMLKGKFYHIKEIPIVGMIDVKKYWHYRKDGLINEVLDNFKKMNELSYFERVIFEINFILTDRWRYLQYYLYIINVYKELLLCKNMTVITKILLGPLMILGGIYAILKRSFKVLRGSVKNDYS